MLGTCFFSPDCLRRSSPNLLLLVIFPPAFLPPHVKVSMVYLGPHMSEFLHFFEKLLPALVEAKPFDWRATDSLCTLHECYANRFPLLHLLQLSASCPELSASSAPLLSVSCPICTAVPSPVWHMPHTEAAHDTCGSHASDWLPLVSPMHLHEKKPHAELPSMIFLIPYGKSVNKPIQHAFLEE